MIRAFTHNTATYWRERGYQDANAGRSKLYGMNLARDAAGDEAVTNYLVGYRGAMKAKEDDAA
jgi:hypothetical protein